MRRFIYVLLILFITVTPALAVPRTNVSAATISPAEMISMVNSLRTSYGLPALVEDAILNSTAYATAAQMAANGVCAHIGGARDRIAAAGFGGGATIFATENMACAVSADISWLQSVWADDLHMLPMTDSRYTHVGAGTYTGSNGTTYYVLHAAYTAGGSYVVPSVTDAPAITSEPWIEPVITATPQEDGSIIHIVKYGQALSTIATWYGVTVEQIQQLNNLIGENIYEGQSLIIRLAPTVTITPTRTLTPQQPTRTPSLTATPTRRVTPVTPTPTATPGFMESLPKIDRQWLGFGLLIISALGLFVVLFFEFIKPKFRKK